MKLEKADESNECMAVHGKHKNISNLINPKAVICLCSQQWNNLECQLLFHVECAFV